MKATVFKPFKVLGVILLVIAITLLFMAAVHEVQTLLASIGWNGLASVSWNG